MPLLGGSMAREFAAGRENGKGVCCWEGDAARVQFTPPNPPRANLPLAILSREGGEAGC